MTFSFADCFSNIPDHRVIGRSDYPLIEILFLCISAIVSGMDGWEDIEEFGNGKLDWLRKYFPYEKGIPKHDTIARVMAVISPKALQESFVNWVQCVSDITEGEIIAIDGKQARRSYDKRSRRSAIHMVSAWASQNGIVLGQQKTDDKSNEITAIPKLLKLLEIKGCIITIDAMGCQKDIAQAIQEKGADYVLALKGNQGKLNDEVRDFFETAIKEQFKNIEKDEYIEFDKGHGRLESRRCYAVEVPAYLKEFKNDWKGLKSFVCIQSERDLGEKIERENRYYISSLMPNAERLAKAVRSHWGIENSLHWVLDMTFKEDASRIRRGVAAENMTVMKHLAINLLKKDQKNKISLPRKRRKALLYDDYRDNVIAGGGF
jgi:predicted transposase YbfD/YdcC